MNSANPFLLCEIDVLSSHFCIDVNELEVVKEIERLTRMIAEMKMVIDCNKCENRGKVNGLTQEIFCDGCIHVDRWKKDYFKPSNNHRETK